ncbi:MULTISPECIES: HAD family hydrolase [unclassified Isoptericola]|uniref:HAD family hydrolase n=1 Tax=unclassified Isoptericola TaxID=2623355 RepID=UPI0027135E8A|nr:MULTISPECIES: HAD family hydrolase [unclassified Isoptericola]MDO8147080.1 HAD family hydrolase [Isoptericola sp. b515]MDO8150605.1 HAD family hydrolase [Isoptericola sp. b408]
MTTTAPLPRLVATDLDGTLLRPDGTVSERTRAALRAVEDAGVEVLFVTARPPRWLDGLADCVGGHGRVVCLGGAAVWDLATGTAEEVHGFEDDTLRTIVGDLRDAVQDVALALERHDGPTFDPWFPRGEPGLPDAVRAVPVERTLDPAAVRTGRPAPVGKLLAVRPGPGRSTRPGDVQRGDVGDADQEEFFATVRSVVGQRAHLAFSGAAGLAELLAPEVTKDGALARWCARLGIDAEDVWAFGDMPNDLAMLRWAGRGHAVADAHPDLLAGADVVVGSAEDDGVAATLEAALRSV